MYIYIYIQIYLVCKRCPGPGALDSSFPHGRVPPPNLCTVSEVYMIKLPGRLPGRTLWGSSWLYGMSLGSLE